MTISFPDTIIPVDQIPKYPTFFDLSLGTGLSSITGTPPVNTVLNEFGILITSNATVATAGIVELVITLNGATLIKTHQYLPSAPGQSGPILNTGAVPLNGMQYAVGTGDLVISISSQLTNGEVFFGGYFI